MKLKCEICGRTSEIKESCKCADVSESTLIGLLYCWVNVDDALPTDEGFYLVCHDKEKVFKCDCWLGDHWADQEATKLVNQLNEPDDEKEEYDITHWMRLPPPPKS